MANFTREILTLQIGHYANFVGTHWWNIQESTFVYTASEAAPAKEINSDILFREGCNLMREVTYTPRLVAFDLKGSLKTLPQEGVLYKSRRPKEDLQWTNDITVHKSAQYEKNEFLQDLQTEEEKYLPVEEKTSKDIDTAEIKVDPSDDGDESVEGGEEAMDVMEEKMYSLDESVEVWSDFLRPHLHPRSLHIIQEYMHDDDFNSFDVFGCGEALYDSRNSREAIDDRLHFFLEECDQLQGFHVLADTHNAFGGLAASITQEIADEYSGKGVTVFGVVPPTFKQYVAPHTGYRLLNTVLAYDRLIDSGSLFLPLSLATGLGRTSAPPTVEFPYINYESALPYHSSAILAASLETATLPYRLTGGATCLMTHLTSALSPAGRKVASLLAALPYPMSPQQALVAALRRHGDQSPWRPLTPMCSAATAPDAQSVVMRGFAESILSWPLTGDRGRSRAGTSVDEVIRAYWEERFPSTLSNTTVLPQMCKLSAPWPRLFNEHISTDGWLATDDRPPNKAVDRVPMATALRSSADTGRLIQHVCDEARRVNVKRLHRFATSGLEADDLQESVERLTTLASCYT